MHTQTKSAKSVDYCVNGLDAVEICQYLLDNELVGVFHKIPDQFVRQAQAGFDYFEVNYEDLELDHIRIALHDVELIDGMVWTKFKMSGVLDMRSGELCPITKHLVGAQQYLHGFNSLKVAVDPDLFTKKDYKLLESYAHWWQEVKAQGGNLLYTKYPNNRLYLAARNTKFRFQFKLDLRTNPQGEYVLGIGNDIKVNAPTFFDTFSGLLVSNPLGLIEKAGAQRTGYRKLQRASGIQAPPR